MARFNPYLHFKGNTEDAFHFYQTVFSGEFTRLSRYEDLPPIEGFTLPENSLKKIMWIELPIGNGNKLIGSDAILESPDREFTMGDNYHIAISTDTLEEAVSLFDKLSTSGRIDVPLSTNAEGSHLGMLVDQFGVQWTVEYSKN